MKKFIAVLIIIIILGFSAYFYMNKEEITEDKSVNIIDTFYSQKETWENIDLMPLGGISGIYQTGYSFIDIDLDGEKELAVQLGGGTLHNCQTIFYEIENRNIKSKEIFDETYSISVNELRKYTDTISGESFYINKYTLKVEPTKYITCIDKIVSGTNGIEVHNLFSIEEVYSENKESTSFYYIGENAVDKNIYYAEYDKIFTNAKEEIFLVNFISSEEWKTMDETQQKNALEKSYSNEDYEYVMEIHNNLILQEVKEENIKTLDIILTDKLYGKDLPEYKQITNIDEVTARVITDGKTFVTIIPTPDFLDIQTFYYKDGRKVAYVKEFMGVGGSAEYYLRNGEIVFINKNKVEERMLFKPEEAVDISIRANNVYSEYIK